MTEYLLLSRWEELLPGEIDLEKVNEDGDVKVKCPFHLEDIPSCSINLNTGGWRCFGCDRQGNLIDFACELMGYSESEAYEWLGGESTLRDRVREAVEKVKVEKPEVEPLDPSVAERYHKNLLASPKHLDYFLKVRQISREVLEVAQVGLCLERKRFTYPVYVEGNLVNVRFYDPKATDGNKVVSWKKGYGKPRLFPLHAYEELSNYHTIVLCEGEGDTLCAMTHFAKEGVAFLTGGACTVWDDSWNELFDNKTGIICFDVNDPDNSGRNGSISVAKHLLPHASEIKVVTLPIDIIKGDITDWVVQKGATNSDFWELVDHTPTYPPVEVEEDSGIIESIIPTEGYLAKAVKLGIQANDAPELYHLASAIMCIGVAAGNHISVEAFGNRFFLNSWVLLVGPSGNRKTTASRFQTKILLSAITFLHKMAEETGPESFLSALKDADGVGWVEWSEFGRYLEACENQDYMAGHKEMITSLYDSGDTGYTRKLQRETVCLEHPALSICAQTTPEWLKANRSDMMSGFFGRWIIFPAPRINARMGLKESAHRGVPSTEVNALICHLRRIWDNKESTSRTLRFTDEACDVFDNWYSSFLVKMQSGEVSEEAMTVIERLSSDYTLKLSGIHCLSRNPSAIYIEDLDMKWATRIVEFLADSLNTLVINEMTFSTFDAAQKDVYSFVERSGAKGTTLTVLLRNKRQYRPVYLKEILQALYESRRIGVVIERKTQGKAVIRIMTESYAPPTAWVKDFPFTK